MAITIHQSPTGYASAHSELWHVVESTNKSTSGFKYIFDIYKDATLLARLRNSPYGADKLGIIDVHNIVRSQLATENIAALDFEETVVLDEDIFWTEYDVRYGEISGGVLTANIASGTHRVYNNYPRSLFDNKSSEITGGMLLSNRPDISFMYDNDNVFISWFAASGQTYTFTSNSSRLGTGTPYAITVTGDNNARVYGMRSQDYNNLSEATFQISGSVSGIIKNLKIRKKCSKYERHILIFLNAFGAYDSFTFIHGKKILDNQKKSFQSQPYFWDGTEYRNSNGVFGVEAYYVNYRESKKIYNSEHQIKMQLTSDLLSTSEYNWLAELINSPLVYYKLGANLLPVIITDSNYEFKDERINKADTLTVNIEFSEKTNTQFR